MYKNQGVLFCFLVFFLYSCTGDSERLTSEERYSLDTTYANNLSQLRIKADSLCNVLKDSMYKAAVDSVISDRLEEIELLTGSKEGLNIPTE